MKVIISVISILVLISTCIYFSLQETGWDQLGKARENGVKNITITKPMRFRYGTKIYIQKDEVVTIYSPDLIRSTRR